MNDALTSCFVLVASTKYISTAPMKLSNDGREKLCKTNTRVLEGIAR